MPQRTVEQQIAALDFDSLITQVKMDIAARANQQKTEPSIQVKAMEMYTNTFQVTAKM